MRIRDLQWRALPAWPPEWFFSCPGSEEVGILEGVRIRDELTPKFIAIEANCLGKIRKGVIILEDSNHLKVLFHKLKDNIGKALTEIGGLEIDFNSSLALKNPQIYRNHCQSV